MNNDEIHQLARELISKVVSELQAKDFLTFTEEDGAPILVATSEGSVLHFNPQRWAERIIAQNRSPVWVSEESTETDAHTPKTSGVTQSEEEMMRQAERALIRLLTTVDMCLGEGLWMLSELAQAQAMDELGIFMTKVQMHVKWSVLRNIDTKLRELLRLPEKDARIALAEMEQLKGGNYDYAVTDFDMVDALLKLERFSIKGLARLLAPEKDDFRPSVYDWMRRKGIDRAELEKWWRRFHVGVEKSD